MEKLGFIGLGVMGGHMARHLSRFDLVVYDIDAEKISSVKARGAESIAAIGATADIVFLSLPVSEIVRQVVTGKGGLAEAMNPGGLVVDMSTTEPAVSKAMAAVLKEKGVDFVDAPVSGGESAAKEGTLAIMTGGSEQANLRCRPYLEALGKSIVHVGSVGAGGVTKLVNNMIVGAAFSSIAEGFALGMINGIDPEILYQAIKDGWAGSKVLEVAAPGIIAGDYTPGGTVDMLFKDLGYALSLARSQNVPVPITAAVDEIFKAARASGRGGRAQQIIIQLWEELLGIGNSNRPNKQGE